MLLPNTNRIYREKLKNNEFKKYMEKTKNTIYYNGYCPYVTVENGYVICRRDGYVVSDIVLSQFPESHSINERKINIRIIKNSYGEKMYKSSSSDMIKLNEVLTKKREVGKATVRDIIIDIFRKGIYELQNNKEEISKLLEKYNDEFREWLFSRGVEIYMQFLGEARRRGSKYRAYGVLARSYASRREFGLVKNLFVAWLVANNVISTYVANKLAGGAGGWHPWYKRIRGQ